MQCDSRQTPRSWGRGAHLVVAFKGFGQRVVDDKAHVGLVDAHTKGNGGSDDLDLVGGPVLLHPLSLIRGQPSMVVPTHTVWSYPAHSLVGG